MVRVLNIGGFENASLYGREGADYVFYPFSRKKVWLVQGFFPLEYLVTLIVTLCGRSLGLYGRANRPIRAPESPVS
jgi:hypothetical protein